MKTKYLFPETDTLVPAQIIVQDGKTALLYVFPVENFDPFFVIADSYQDKTNNYYIDAREPFLMAPKDLSGMVERLKDI